jgi:tetratricopeptide (TPR) repeat protein
MMNMYRAVLWGAVELAAFNAAAPTAWAADTETCANATGDESIAACSRLIARHPRDVGAYIRRAVEYRRNGDYDHAIADDDLAIQLDPRAVAAWINRCRAWNGKKDYDRAIPDCDQAIRLDDRSALAWNERGMVYNNKGEHDRAIANFEQAIRLDPQSATYRNNRGWAYSGKGEYDRALANFDEAISLDPNNTVAYGNRCRTYNARQDYDRAITDCSQAIRLNPGMTRYYARRATAYSRKGDYVRAIADLDQVIQLNPESVNGYNSRGDAYAGKGEYAHAVADYDRVLALDPGNAMAKQNRERTLALAAPRPDPAPPPSPAAGPERRAALVIGNSQYKSVAFLANPRRDAKAVADALREVGFQTVELAVDLDRDGMVKALQAFRSEADKADWALIYFAGHGLAIGHDNYVIPTDAVLKDERDVKIEAVSSEELLNAVSGAKLLRIVVLDACRNNPFNDQMRRLATRGAASRGLAPPPESNSGTMVVYSAKDGEVAADDADGVNSPFAHAFLTELKVPGREVRRLFDDVRDDVLDATDQRQQPFTYGSLPGRKDFYFVTAK